jgi:formylglycine-generating enzyme required for sulfatase activity
LDCDDGDPATHPGVPELCDGQDNDCDGVVPADETDADGDGYRICGNDCNDGKPTVHPGAPEICDGLDNQCPGDAGYGQTDEGCITCTDSDGDSYYAEPGCGSAVDCDNGKPTVHPGAPEICDGLDNQCPGDAGYGDIDEGCVQDMVQIPAGCFDMGDAFTEGGSDELPVHHVCISAFEMDVHEVTNSEYAECVDAGACTPPAKSGSSSRPTYYGDPGYDDYPVIWVDWDQATEYCQWSGERLPTEAEWEDAARGGLAGNRYPWGDAISGLDANYWSSGDPEEGDTNAVGSYPDNGYGLFDMAGNVSEWVADWYLSDYYPYCVQHGIVNDPQGPANGWSRIQHGGSCHSDPRGLRVADRASSSRSHKSESLGFRCAR